MTDQAAEKNPPSWAWWVALICFFPWVWGMIIGLLVSPFISGFRHGREMAGEISRDMGVLETRADGQEEDKTK